MSIRGSKLIDTIGTILAALLPVAVCAATYKVDIDRSDGLYCCGETATFAVRLISTNALTSAASPCARIDNFGTSVQTNMPFDVTVTGVAFTVSGTLSEPEYYGTPWQHDKMS